VAGDEVTLRPIPGIALSIRGDRAALRHFTEEYGSARPTVSDPSGGHLEVRFVRGPKAARWGRHKSVAWRARLTRPWDRTYVLEIELRGIPRWFGLSLVQGYLVEPVLSLLVAEADGVLLPAAGIGPADGVTVLIGQSRTGKSSLSLRALGAGMPILGDDQVVVSGDGRVMRFPRRLRVYDDIARTAPQAARSLPSNNRRALRMRRAIRLATGGAVAPSLAIQAEALGVELPASGTIRRVVLLRREDVDAKGPMRRPASVEEAVDASAEALAAQRQRLRRAIGPSLDETLTKASDAEKEVLGRAFTSVEIATLTIPKRLSAEVAVPATAHLLDLP
jgi:hypothetical protein